MTSTKIGLFLALCALAGVRSQEERASLPPNPCPNLLQFLPNKAIGFYDAEATVVLSPTDKERGAYELEAKITVVGNLAPQAGLKINMKSTNQDISSRGTIVYRITFPFTPGEVLPYLTLLKFNGRPICQGEDPPLKEDQIRSSLSAKTSVSFSGSGLSAGADSSASASSFAGSPAARAGDAADVNIHPHIADILPNTVARTATPLIGVLAR